MSTEAEVSKELEKFFQQQGWEYRKEWVTKSGKAIDFLIKAPYGEGHIFFGIECKKDLNQKSKATTLADYLEQASAYAKDLDMPVFLAPVISSESNSGIFSGGTNLDSTAALLIFGGRFNVGALVKQEQYWNGAYAGVSWSMVIRGAKFWDVRNGFNPKRLNTVCSNGSKKERKKIKIWKS
jgi:hypothetical protein